MSLFVVNIQETVFNYVCVHLESEERVGNLVEIVLDTQISSPINSNSLL